MVHLSRNIDIIHVPLENVILLIFSFALELLIPLLIDVKWVPIEPADVVFLVFRLCDWRLNDLIVWPGLDR
jgi:hypothetical protein